MTATNTNDTPPKRIQCHQIHEYHQCRWVQLQRRQSHRKNGTYRRQYIPRFNRLQIPQVKARDLVENGLFIVGFGFLQGVWEHYTKIIPTLVAIPSVTVFTGSQCVARGVGQVGILLASLMRWLKGFLNLFPKSWSYSVETVDRVGIWHGKWDPRYFVSKLPYLQMSCPQSWSVCQPVLTPSRLQALPQNFYNLIDNIGLRLS